MILFTDGFEYFCPEEIQNKWNVPSAASHDFQIIQGMDNSKSPPVPFARKIDGRALYVNTRTELVTHIRKSRTVFVGVGINPTYIYRSSSSITYYPHCNVGFYTRIVPGMEGGTGGLALVANCTMFINGNDNTSQTAVTIRWSFPSAEVPDIYDVIDPNTNLFTSGWSYHQCGITIHGNDIDGATAWVENRIGSNTIVRNENVFTVPPGEEDIFYINAIKLQCTAKYAYDDFYVCNDEGMVNNTFLNPIHIRATAPIQQGMRNNAIGVGTSEVDRAQAVNSAMVGTEQLPYPLPTPIEDQHFVEWEDPRSTYLKLPRLNSEQTFDFRNINFAGANPKFLGAVSYLMCRPGFYDAGQTGLEPTMYAGLRSLPLTEPLRKPLAYQQGNEWEVRRGIFENQSLSGDQNYEDPVWNRDGIQNVEFGLKVIRHEDHPETYLPGFTRLSYTFDDFVDEQLILGDIASRRIEAVVEETFELSSMSHMQLTYVARDGFELSDDGSKGVRGLKKYVTSILYLQDEIPWTYLSINEPIAIEDAVQITWEETIEETMGFIDSSYHEWVEELVSILTHTDRIIRGVIVFANDGFEVLDIPKTNHELIEEDLQLDSSYLFSGHELIEETLYLDFFARVGVNNLVDDGFTLDQDHFDGHLVEQIPHQFSMVDDVLTQHWRHEWFMGVCIRSWQIDPVEQEGDDGSRVGDYVSIFD